MEYCSSEQGITENCKVFDFQLRKGTKYYLQKKTTNDEESKNISDLYEYIGQGEYVDSFVFHKRHYKSRFQRIISGKLRYYYGEKVDIEISDFDIILADKKTQTITVYGKKGGSKKIKSRKIRRTRKKKQKNQKNK